MRLSLRKTRIGLLCLAVFLGGALPCLLSLLHVRGSLAESLLGGAAFAVLILLAQTGPFWMSLTGGLVVMAATALLRLPQFFVLPLPVVGYEAACLAAVPFLLSGLSRLWLYTVGRARPAGLLTLFSLLAVSLLMRCGWVLLADSLYASLVNLRAVIPSLSRLLLLLLVQCTTYALCSLLLFPGRRAAVPPART